MIDSNWLFKFSYILYEDLCVCVQIQHLGLVILAAKDALDCFKTIPDICCFSVLTILQGQTMNNWIYFGHEFEKSNKLDMN